MGSFNDSFETYLRSGAGSSQEGSEYDLKIKFSFIFPKKMCFVFFSSKKYIIIIIITYKGVHDDNFLILARYVYNQTMLELQWLLASFILKRGSICYKTL